MKNKFLVTLLIAISAAVMLCGCSNSASSEAEQIKIYGDSTWIFDDTTIAIPKDYSFKDFSKDYGDDTITVTITYRKNQTNEN